VSHEITLEPYLSRDSQFSTSSSVAGSHIHWDILFSPNGKLLVFSEEHDLVFLHGKTFEFLFSFASIESSITSMRFVEQDPLLLITGHQNGSHSIWNISNRKLQCTYQFHIASILALTNTKHYFIAGCRHGRITIWDLHSKKGDVLIGELNGHTMDVHDMITVPEDDNVVVSAGRDGNIFLWNVETQKKIISIKKITSIWSMCYSGCRTCLVGYQNGVVERLDYYTGQTLQCYTGHIKPVCGVARIDNHVYSTSQDGYIMTFDLISGWIREVLPGFTGEGSISSHQHRYLATAALKEDSIRIWRFKPFPNELINLTTVYSHFCDIVFDL
jgi:WD40 repeat protein